MIFNVSKIVDACKTYDGEDPFVRTARGLS